MGASASFLLHLHPGGHRPKYPELARVACRERTRPPGEGATPAIAGPCVIVNKCRVGRGQQLPILVRGAAALARPILGSWQRLAAVSCGM